MATITKSLTIESQGTYNLTFDLWSYSEWATSAGITTSYASLAALIADEKAVRQLMTVHASVDYFANCPDSTTISTVINNNLCAKWINLRDYAFDKLSAKSNIKSVMNTADKYGYGEWGKINSTTWGPLGNIPIMTSDSAPYGTVRSSGANSGSEAYKAFDGNSSTYFMSSTHDISSNFWVSYKAVNPIKPKKAYVQLFNTDGYAAATKFKIQGSNDGFASDINDVSAEITCTVGASSVVRPYDPVEVDITTDAYYMEYRIIRTYTSIDTRFNVVTFQLYGRELKPLVPIMTSNTIPKGTAFSNQNYDTTQAFYSFDGNYSTNWASPNGSSNPYIGYITNGLPVCIKSIKIVSYRLYTGIIEGSNDTTTGHDGTWTQIGGTLTIANNDNDVNNLLEIDNDNIYKAYRFKPITRSASYPCAIRTLQFYSMDYSEKEFAQGSTRKTIYDHGVAPSGAITGGTKNPDCLTLSAVGTATVTINKGTRKYMGGKAGLHASGTNRLKCGSGYSAFTASNMPDSNGFDISSISGSVAVGIEQTASGTFDCTEIWIE